MAHFKLTLAYDGSNFSGWQTQPDRRTVQDAVETAWRKITGEVVRVTAASRTDAGVHALGQVVGIETDTHLTADDLFGAVNAHLPEDVVLCSIEPASAGFHATHDSVGKRYRYQIHNDRQRPLLDRHYVWQIPQPLDVATMHDAAQALVGTHDFASFQSAGSPRESTVRTISAVEVEQGRGLPPSRICIEVEGDGFLYNMVRIVVGVLVDVGVGRRPPESIAEILAARDRRVAGQTAPAQGLMLLHVRY